MEPSLAFVGRRSAILPYLHFPMLLKASRGGVDGQSFGVGLVETRVPVRTPCSVHIAHTYRSACHPNQSRNHHATPPGDFPFLSVAFEVKSP